MKSNATDTIGTCGKTCYPTGLIAGGDLADRGQFPWYVCFEYIKENTKKLTGGGSLISNRFVLTGEYPFNLKLILYLN
jgi:hypothetical protein